MLGLRGSVRFAPLVLLALTSASRASAQLLVATPPGVTDSVAHAELAYALGEGPPVTWVSLRMQRAPLALVAALTEGAVADTALDAWLSALEATASPRVLLPRGTTHCGESSFVEVAWPRSRGAAPDELRLESVEDVESVLSERGLAIAGELPSASAYVVWSWTGLTAPTTTRTLRVQGGAAPLSFLPSSPFPILLSAITRGAMSYVGEVDASSLDVTFFAGPSEHFAGPTKRSDYRARIDDWLNQPADPLFEVPRTAPSYVETRSRGLLYDWSIYQDLVAVAPLIRTYATRASAERPELDVEACGNALADLREPDSDLDSMDCGAARDAALALLTADPRLATLQRFVVSGARGASAESLSAGGETRPPTLRAKRLQAADCPEPQQPPQVVDPVVSGGSMGSNRETRDDGELVVEETVTVERHEPVAFDCSGGTEPAPDEGYGDDDDVDCSSDTSSSSDASDSEIDCSGDTSTTGSSDGEDADCSDDTSSSTSDDSQAASCSDDTSGSRSDDADCSDDTSSSSSDDGGYDGDTCASVSATPRATQESQAGLTRGKRARAPRRLKTSLWSVALAAFALPIRRRKRGARTVS